LEKKISLESEEFSHLCECDPPIPSGSRLIDVRFGLPDPVSLN